MPLIHVGIRPEFKIMALTREFKSVKDHYCEMLSDGSYKIWTTRMLESGCNKRMSMDDGIIQSGDNTINNLIYCKHCDEFFSRNQFKESE